MTTPLDSTTGNAWDERFERVLRVHLAPGAAPLSPDDRLFELGLDSLAVVQLATDLEDAYGVFLPDESLTRESFATPGRLWAVVHPLLPADR
ncbi:phosphopantetheine-binding protein [Dactylosporangium sp. NPDC000555]|uniref:phosphopantetheine-binding protein n=1 Tax=Dactylosporangium sp. NPDC000555 TaxID=3154260 RepID=UPI00331B228E